MAEKTNLTFEEVSDLLMTSPLSVYEWVQKGMLHAAATNSGKSGFNLNDVQAFSRDLGISINRPDQEKLRILIIDVDVRQSSSLVELFNTLSETVEVSAAHSGFEAGRALYDFCPDIVLIDPFMLGQEGFEICRRIKSDYSTRHIKLIALLDPRDADYKQRLFMMGAEACISKPISHKELFESVGVSLHNPVINI